MKIPVLRATQVIRALKRAGFSIVRQKGSHVFLRHVDGRTTIIPNHPSDWIEHF